MRGCVRVKERIHERSYDEGTVMLDVYVRSEHIHGNSHVVAVLFVAHVLGLHAGELGFLRMCSGCCCKHYDDCCYSFHIPCSLEDVYQVDSDLCRSNKMCRLTGKNPLTAADTIELVIFRIDVAYA